MTPDGSHHADRSYSRLVRRSPDAPTLAHRRPTAHVPSPDAQSRESAGERVRMPPFPRALTDSDWPAARRRRSLVAAWHAPIGTPATTLPAARSSEASPSPRAIPTRFFWRRRFRDGRISRTTPVPNFTAKPSGDTGDPRPGGLFHRLRKLITLVLSRWKAAGNA